ncbi:NUDIX domain-containing protein [Kitasatospora sp. NPDC059408]|uniref:NUDIX domain-containing protein n=1 Tax=Kitasatospora sp. NPDC059408 TaxID=3346823 RepID=UPI00369CE6D1
MNLFLADPEAPPRPAILTDPNPVRVGCVVLALDEHKRVLMVDPVYKDGLILPGGSMEEDEDPNEAASRHFYAETGLVQDFHQLVVPDWSRRDVIPAGINFVFWGGRLDRRRADKVKVPPVQESNLRGHHWIDRDELRNVCSKKQANRVTTALDCVEAGLLVPFMVDGEPVGR